MDPVSAWTLMAFMTVISAALLLLEVGMRRARGDETRTVAAHRPLRRGHHSR
jgi:hypothetical protein